MSSGETELSKPVAYVVRHSGHRSSGLDQVPRMKACATVPSPQHRYVEAEE